MVEANVLVLVCRLLWCLTSLWVLVLLRLRLVGRTQMWYDMQSVQLCARSKILHLTERVMTRITILCTYNLLYKKLNTIQIFMLQRTRIFTIYENWIHFACLLPQLYGHLVLTPCLHNTETVNQFFWKFFVLKYAFFFVCKVVVAHNQYHH